MKELNFTVGEEENGIMLRELLYSKGLSKTVVKKAKLGGLSVSGEAVTVRRILKTGEVVKVRLPEQSREDIEPIDIPIRIVYEDDYILAVDKPTNMPTHPSKGNSLPTLANAVMARMGRDFVFRAVNRLDRDTSGLVLIAKDAYTCGKLSQQIRQRRIIKKYLALVEGIPAEDHGIINASIRREAEDSVKRVVAKDGKDAITEYSVTEKRDGCSLLEVTLHTGRTHQIRVHLSYLGHPLIGDFLYGKRSDNGYFLRCHYLEFKHPITSENIIISI